jgi:hypothetical protein
MYLLRLAFGLPADWWERDSWHMAEVVTCVTAILIGAVAGLISMGAGLMVRVRNDVVHHAITVIWNLAANGFIASIMTYGTVMRLHVNSNDELKALFRAYGVGHSTVIMVGCALAWPLATAALALVLRALTLRSPRPLRLLMIAFIGSAVAADVLFRKFGFELQLRWIIPMALVQSIATVVVSIDTIRRDWRARLGIQD